MSNSSFAKSAPLVTIAIPFHRPGPYFELALRSVFAQTFTDWELLLIDDGGPGQSNDAALSLARSLRDPRVHLHSDGLNRGLAARLNQAARLARGRYLFRMDADDLMHPTRVARQLQALRQATPDTVIGTAAYTVDEASHVVGIRPATPRHGIGYAMRHSFVHPTVAAHTAWFLRNPYSEEPVFRRSEDAELWCRTSPHTRFAWLSSPLLFYREAGVFSLPAYLGSGDGLLELARRTEPNAFRRIKLRQTVRIKNVIARTLHRTGAQSLLIRNRYCSLPTTALAEANLTVSTLLNTPLPI